MSLADAIASSRKPVNGSRCTVARLRDRLTPDDLATLDASLADPDTTSTQIARGLTAIGQRVLDTTIARHRRGDCLCPRP